MASAHIVNEVCEYIISTNCINCSDDYDFFILNTNYCSRLVQKYEGEYEDWDDETKPLMEDFISYIAENESVYIDDDIKMVAIIDKLWGEDSGMEKTILDTARYEQVLSILPANEKENLVEGSIIFHNEQKMPWRTLCSILEVIGTGKPVWVCVCVCVCKT